jgi:hypothetical protein
MVPETIRTNRDRILRKLAQEPKKEKRNTWEFAYDLLLAFTVIFITGIITAILCG